MMSPAMDAVSAAWRASGGAAEALGALTLPAAAPASPSSFHVDAAAQAAIGAATLAASALLAARQNRAEPPACRVAQADAVVECQSEKHVLVDAAAPPPLWDPIAGVYSARNGGWIRVHTNFAHHRDALLRALGGAPAERAAVADAIAASDAEALEAAVLREGGVAAALRRFESWDAGAAGAALAAEPAPFALERVGDAPPPPPADAARPAEGLRVLEMARIIAAPVAGRSLAAHGADVLRVAAPHLPDVAVLEMDGGRGKRSTHLDLRAPGDRAAFERLVDGADMVIQAYRPGALDALGVGPAALIARRRRSERPGLIVAELCAYGFSGPWADRRGFDSIVQCASGFNAAEAEAAGDAAPRALPFQALDHCAGHWLAFGMLRAAERRIREGGSWRVRVSLAGVGRWLRGLGRVENGFAAQGLPPEAVAARLETRPSGFGALTAVMPAGDIDGARPALERPAAPHGADPPVWL